MIRPRICWTRSTQHINDHYNITDCKSSLLKRIAHPGGAVATNKAVSVAKFLKRKLQEPGGFGSLDPELIERAVENIKETANARYIHRRDSSMPELKKLKNDGKAKKKLKRRTKNKTKEAAGPDQ